MSSLARTALRLAAVAALGADPVVSSLCGPRIYDSLIDELDSSNPVPVIVVYTEDDGGKAWDPQNGGPPFNHACSFAIEISMRMSEAISTDEIVVGVPGTDAEMEATLDLLEEYAVNAVTIADTPQASLIRKAVTRRTLDLSSIRFASAETGAKMAMRVVTLKTELKDDTTIPLNPPTGLFAALPDPLRTVALSLPTDSYGYATCAALATKLTVATAAAMTGIDLTLQLTGPLDPANPPSETAANASDPITESIDFA